MSNDFKDYWRLLKIPFRELRTSPGEWVISIEIKARPGSKSESVSLNEQGVLTLKIRERPIEGEANSAIEEKLADLFGLSKGQVMISKGKTSKNKTVIISYAFTTQKDQLYYLKKLQTGLMGKCK